MNFTIFLFLGLIVFGILWLATKFLGKTGLFILLTLFAVLNCALAGSASYFLTANVSIELIFYVPTIFIVYLIWKKYGINDFIKSIVMYIGVILTFALTYFTLYLYMGGIYPEYYTFAYALNEAIVPFLISLLSAIILLVIAFIFKNIKFFGRFNDSFKWFLILDSALFISNFISVLITETIGRFPFGQIILDVFMGYLFAIIILGLLFLFEKYALKFEDNSNFEEKIKTKVVNAYSKTKNAMKSTVKPTDNKEEINEEEVTEIIVEDKEKINK